jgi:hypothetical protein
MEQQKDGGDGGGVDDVARDIERFQLSGEGGYQPHRGAVEAAPHAPPTGVELQRRIFVHNKPHASGGLQWVDDVELKKQRRYPTIPSPSLAMQDKSSTTGLASRPYFFFLPIYFLFYS